MARKAPQIDGAVSGVRDKGMSGTGTGGSLNDAGSMYNTGASASLAKGNMQDRGRGPKAHSVAPKPGGKGFRGEKSMGDKTGFKASPSRKAMAEPQKQRGFEVHKSLAGAGVEKYEPRHTSKLR